MLAFLLCCFFTVTKATSPNVFVFGDSWGAYGPSYRAMQAMFTSRNVSAVVKSGAQSGTTACQWARNPTSLADEAAKAFPDGPDFVWFTLGGNDMLDSSYQGCLKRAKTPEDVQKCRDQLYPLVLNCIQTLLTNLWKRFPRARVVQCGYEIACEEGSCIPNAYAPDCGMNRTCLGEGSLYFQEKFLGQVQAANPTPLYTVINVLGSVQVAGGVTGAAVGRPVIDQGSPCSLMAECVHPAYGTKGATAVMDSFWALYFSKTFQ